MAFRRTSLSMGEGAIGPSGEIIVSQQALPASSQRVALSNACVAIDDATGAMLVAHADPVVVCCAECLVDPTSGCFACFDGTCLTNNSGGWSIDDSGVFTGDAATACLADSATVATDSCTAICLVTGANVICQTAGGDVGNGTWTITQGGAFSGSASSASSATCADCLKNGANCVYVDGSGVLTNASWTIDSVGSFSGNAATATAATTASSATTATCAACIRDGANYVYINGTACFTNDTWSIDSSGCFSGSSQCIYDGSSTLQFTAGTLSNGTWTLDSGGSFSGNAATATSASSASTSSDACCLKETASGCYVCMDASCNLTFNTGSWTISPTGAFSGSATTSSDTCCLKDSASSCYVCMNSGCCLTNNTGAWSIDFTGKFSGEAKTTCCIPVCASAPAATCGELFVCSSNNNAYIYLNSTWCQINN